MISLAREELQATYPSRNGSQGASDPDQLIQDIYKNRRCKISRTGVADFWQSVASTRYISVEVLVLDSAPVLHSLSTFVDMANKAHITDRVIERGPHYEVNGEGIIMMPKFDMGELIKRPVRPDRPVLTVYLNVDQSRAANRNRMFEVKLANRLRAAKGRLDQRSRDAFESNAERVLRFVADYEPRMKGLIIVCDDSEDFFWTGEVNVPVVTGIRWSDAVYLKPLLEMLDENERYGVVLTDRSQARLFTVFLGGIEGRQSLRAPAEVTHVKSSGRDRMLSQMRHQRRSDTQALLHLKQVADTADQLAANHAFDRLVLAGPVEATSEVQRLLSKRLRSKVIGATALPVDATEQQVLEATLKLVESVEREDEISLVGELIPAAEKQDGAILGLDATLTALQAGRVWRFVYAEGQAARGSRCSNCNNLSAKDEEVCGYCGARVQAVDDLFNRAAKRVRAMGGLVEQLRGEAADRLRAVGGVGAFLRQS